MQVVIEITDRGVERARVPFETFSDITENRALLERFVDGLDDLDRAIREPGK